MFLVVSLSASERLGEGDEAGLEYDLKRLMFLMFEESQVQSVKFGYVSFEQHGLFIFATARPQRSGKPRGIFLGNVPRGAL